MKGAMRAMRNLEKQNLGELVPKKTMGSVQVSHITKLVCIIF